MFDNSKCCVLCSIRSNCIGPFSVQRIVALHVQARDCCNACVALVIAHTLMTVCIMITRQATVAAVFEGQVKQLQQQLATSAQALQTGKIVQIHAYITRVCV